MARQILGPPEIEPIRLRWKLDGHGVLLRGRITEVIEPTDEVPYPTYKVQWRKDEVTATPSDFSEYRVGDRVTILKDVATTKQSHSGKTMI